MVFPAQWLLDAGTEIALVSFFLWWIFNCFPKSLTFTDHCQNSGRRCSLTPCSLWCGQILNWFIHVWDVSLIWDHNVPFLWHGANFVNSSSLDSHLTSSMRSFTFMLADFFYLETNFILKGPAFAQPRNVLIGLVSKRNDQLESMIYPIFPRMWVNFQPPKMMKKHK